MKLSDHIARRNISIGKAADELSMPRETVRRYVRGERIPRPDAMTRIERWSDGAVTETDHYAAYRAAHENDTISVSPGQAPQEAA